MRSTEEAHHDAVGFLCSVLLSDNVFSFDPEHSSSHWMMIKIGLHCQSRIPSSHRAFRLSLPKTKFAEGAKASPGT
ncbi:uncharacterized protein CLUP02_09217 [Colletotrichum lupini]|uniref:Uncharacterized protein n=1 Tax=Colletotrichum lupini TaxID=145971 RepID=A0A9Q8WHQ8_9PEZI|nr:uncharacterized protein CLUP02_09217 [Colletotrichum lupini]UQC83721.1 hypothetical protein CLUP02_09217 [Colletotrichum lupini]